MRKSNDKSKPSHIERTVYVAPTVNAGDSVRYGDWVESKGGYFPFPSYIPLTIIEAATGSDYYGNLVEASNARALKSDFPWLVEIYGGHGTFGVAYLGKRENQNDRLIEAIDALTDYPLYSDDDHSNLEMECADEQWSEAHGGRRDWKRALCKLFDEMEPEVEHDYDRLDGHNDLVDTLWRDCCEMFRGGEEYTNEQGSSIYFPVDRVIEDIEKRLNNMRYAGLDKATYSYDDNRTIREKLTELLEASRATPSLTDNRETSPE